MSMKKGLERHMHAAVDTMHDMSQKLIAAGLPPQYAITAAAVFTKEAATAMLKENVAKLNAAGFTHSLSRDQPRLN